jgi:hypothetical protein
VRTPGIDGATYDADYARRMPSELYWSASHFDVSQAAATDIANTDAMTMQRRIIETSSPSLTEI